MKKFFALTLFILLPSVISFAGSSRFGITLQERLEAQRAIEQVFWNHTIWPAENAEPKPALDAVLSDSEIRAKITDYIRKSEALRLYWHQTITSEMLQKEIDRMARETQDPDVLRELWAALHNDPYLIAECLARPTLVDRLSMRIPSFDEWFEANRRNVTLTLEPLMYSYYLPRITKQSIDPFGMQSLASAGSWSSLPTTGAPSARGDHTAVWTGTQMIVWGGYNGTSRLNTGARYTSSTNSWSSTTTTGAPSGRNGHTAVWDGSEMIVFGGYTGSAATNTGSKYKPSSNSWIAITTTGAPSARSGHTAVWTGSRMVVWGGNKLSGGIGVLNTGGQYNPTSNSWTATATTGAPSARQAHVAVWTGTLMVVWGGNNQSNLLNTGGRYNPSTNSWTATTTTGAPSARTGHTGVWAASRVVIWGGGNFTGTTVVNTGGRYNPSTNSWTATTTTGAPSARDDHAAVSNGGNKMIVWSGWTGSAETNTGGEYDASANTWVATATTGAPSARQSATAVWSGIRMIVFGGITASGTALNTGGKFTP